MDLFLVKAAHHTTAGRSLSDSLAAVLPVGYTFGIYHLSTPPTRSDPLCSAPPDARPDRTYCESHFLAITIDPKQGSRQGQSTSASPPIDSAEATAPVPDNQVLVLAVEIFIFTTAYSSTFFVSKADSTGYLHLLGLAKGTPSPIREITSAFISYLVVQRRREDVQSVISLFARAQSQYLFPGSIKYAGKHVLDDRGLVKWWCRVLDPIIASHQESRDNVFIRTPRGARWENVKGYLVVPGLDAHESHAFLPRTPHASEGWILGHPLERISHFAREYDWVPPRCLIPRFPDDPKSRFRDELDLEAAQWAEHKEKGAWRSVKTLDQFWEMMAFRQECSGGHLTGFIWVVLEPRGFRKAHPDSPPLLTPAASFNEGSLAPTVPSTPPRRRNLGAATPQSSPLKHMASPSGSLLQSQPYAEKAKSKKPKPRGRIRPRQPRIKTHARNYIPDIPESTPYYCWPSEGRGTRVVAEQDYKRSIELLLRLAFANLDVAVASTSRWISEVGGGMKWDVEVNGTRPTAPPAPAPAGGGGINSLEGLVRRKRPAESPAQGDPGAVTSQANVLSAGLVRKKRKPDSSGPESAAAEHKAVEGSAAPPVNVLGAGLIRKKPKPT